MINARTVPLTFRRARLLRRERTDAERVLWQMLRARRLSGLKFRRQFPIGDFIADFCCRECRLVIELDGSQHMDSRQADRDRNRTECMEARGFRVLRFWNTDVLMNTEGVLAAIFRAASQGRTEDLTPILSLDKERERKVFPREEKNQ